MPGLATAADTRILWIGAPDLAVDTNGDGIPDNSGKLYVRAGTGQQLPTKVSKPATDTGPNATMFQVEILNSGGQNLAHTILTINADAQSSVRCPIVPPATEPSATCLDSLKRIAIYDPDGGNDADSTFCTPATGDVITCNYGSLPALGSRTVAVVVSVSDGYDVTKQTRALFSATVTTNNENGQNTQTFSASSGPELDSNGDPIPGSPAFTVDDTAANSLYTFVLDGVDNENLFTSGVGGNGGNLNTNVKFDTSNKELVQINEGDSTTSGFYQCPSGLSWRCINEYSEVTTTSGSFGGPDFFTWKLTALVPKTYALSQGFVAHYPAGATTFVFNDPTNAYWLLFFKNKSALCGTDVAAKIATAGQCILGAPTLTKYDKTMNLLVVTVVMKNQGGMKA